MTGCEINDMGWNSDSGEGGSTSRFTIVNNHLYSVDNQYLRVFNISESDHPEFVRKIKIGFQIETIYPLNNMLFIGSQAAMYIYDITDPTNPERLSTTDHFYSCDPVVSDGEYAYVTLRSGNSCGNWFSNELQIIDINDPEETELVRTYDMDGPYGLAVRGDYLFICDAYDVKVYDKSNAPNLSMLYRIYENVNDVIALDTLLLLVNSSGIYEYTYTYDGAEKISAISLSSQ